MCGGDLGPSTSVDELKPRNGTALVISAQHNATEDAIAQHPRNGDGNAVALQIKFKGRLLVLKTEVGVQPRQ